MSEQQIDALKNIQMMIDGPADPAEAPPFVRGMDLSGVSFTKVAYGHFEMDWRVDAHLTHYDGIVQGGHRHRHCRHRTVLRVLLHEPGAGGLLDLGVHHPIYSPYQGRRHHSRGK